MDPILLPISGSSPGVGGSNQIYATLNQPGFSQTTNMTVTGNNYLTPTATLSNPFPSGVLQPSGSALGAAAYAEAGRFDEAIATAQKACASATAKGETELLAVNQKLLAQYQQHQPYHEAAEKLVPGAP